MITLLDGSRRSAGNTDYLLAHMAAGFERHGHPTRQVALANLDIGHCRTCDCCEGRRTCAIGDDFGSLIDDIVESSAIALGSPVYVGLPSSPMVALLQRLTCFSQANGHILQKKVGAPVVVPGEAAHLTTMNALVDFFLVTGMIVHGSRYWPVGTATARGRVSQDERAKENIQYLARSIAALLERRDHP